MLIMKKPRSFYNNLFTVCSYQAVQITLVACAQRHKTATIARQGKAVILTTQTATALSLVSTNSFVKPNFEGFLYVLPSKLRTGPTLYFSRVTSITHHYLFHGYTLQFHDLILDSKDSDSRGASGVWPNSIFL